MVRFILGRSGYGKTHRVLEEIANAAKGGKNNIVLLVPEPESHAMERKLCQTAGNSISMSAEVVSFRRLCKYVAACAGGMSKTLLDDGGRIMYMYQALKQARADFKVLKSVASRPEFLDTLITIVDQVKACGLSPDELFESAGEFQGSLRDKLEDISTVYAAYQASMTQSRMDSMGELQKLEEDIRKTNYFAGKSVWIDGFTGFTGVEYKILRSMFRQAEEVTISLCADPEDVNACFSKANETYKRLKSLCHGESETIVLTDNMRSKGDGLAFLERNLFSEEAFEPWMQPCAVELHECENTYRECEFAAAKILELVRCENLRFRDISVSVRNVDEYAAELEAVFGYYGVPLYLSRKSPVLDKAPVALAVNALKCVTNNFRYDDMLCYIKTGLTGINSRAQDIFEEYVSTWRIKGYEWVKEDGFTRHPLGYGHEHDESSMRLLHLINRVRDKIRTPLINLKKAIEEDSTGAGYARAIFAYFEEINLAERLEMRSEVFRNKGELQMAEEYASLWEILCGAVNSIGNVLEDASFDADEFTRLFRLVLSKYNVGTIPTALDRVAVGELSRPGTVGNVRCQIILGVNDGNIPMLTATSALFTENDYRQLSDAGIELAPDTQRKLDEEFRLIYSAMTAPCERLILARPLGSGDSGQTRESFVYPKLRELFPNIETEYSSKEVCAAAPIPCFDAAACGGVQWQGAREWFENDADWSAKFRLAERGSKVSRGPIKDKDNIRGVFGGEIKLSASRADTFGSCRYRYFLQYGLKLRRKEVAKLDAPAAGTLIHYVMEKTMRNVESLGGSANVTEQQVEKLATDAAHEYAREKLGGLENQTPRFRFIFDKLCTTAVRVAKDVREELSNSSFQPIDFELRLSDRNGDLSAVRLPVADTTLRLEGIVDRVDGMVDDDGRLCVRVVDYKTGKKDFRMEEALNGLNIQLLVYLFALEQQGEKRYGRDIRPTGVLYIPARDPEISSSGAKAEESLEKDREKELKRKGVLIDDVDILRKMEHGVEEKSKYLPLSFSKDGSLSARSSVISAHGLEKLKQHMNDTLTDIGTQLSKGEIRANPYYKSRSETACDNCPYWSACMFDEQAGDKRRYLFKTDVKEFFAQQGEEVSDDG